jgi:hypothetical protein
MAGAMPSRAQGESGGYVALDALASFCGFSSNKEKNRFLLKGDTDCVLTGLLAFM